MILAISCSILALLCLGCGQTFQLQSLDIAPQNTILGAVGSVQQLTVTGTYKDLKTQSVPATYPDTRVEDVTKRVAYSLQSPGGSVFAPANALAVNSGLVKVMDAACTWTATTDGTTTTYTTTPYILTASLDGVQGTSFISVASSVGCDSPAVGSTSPVMVNVPDQYRKYLQ